jgi:hypothetical protein
MLAKITVPDDAGERVFAETGTFPGSCKRRAVSQSGVFFKVATKHPLTTV